MYRFPLTSQLNSTCVGLSHNIPIKYISVCGCNVTQCGKVQRGKMPFNALYSLFISEEGEVGNRQKKTA